MKRYLVLSLLVSSAILFSSCLSTALRRVRDDIQLKVEALQKARYHQEFSGLQELISASPENGQNLQVLLTHGMRRKETTHFDPLIQDLSLELGFIRASCETIHLNKKTPDDFLLGEGKIIKKVFMNYQSKDTLTFYFVFWSPITEPAKIALFESDKSPYRTHIARFAKQNYFTDVFADKSLYLGPAKDRVQQLFFTALNTIPKGKPMVFMGGSLGSQIFYDFLYEHITTNEAVKKALREIREQIDSETEEIDDNSLSQIFAYHMSKTSTLTSIENEVLTRLGRVQDSLETVLRTSSSDQYREDCKYAIEKCLQTAKIETKSAVNFLENIQKVYLLSNQLPFFNFLDVSPQNSRNPDSLTAFLYRKLEALEEVTLVQRKKPLEIISFHDPNDVLGYRLPSPIPNSPLYNNPDIKIVNVELRNTLRWSFNPQRFRNIYLSQIGIPSIGTFTQDILFQDHPRQEIFLNFDRANEGIQGNPHLVQYILQGSDYCPPEDTRLLLNYRSKKSKSLKQREFNNSKRASYKPQLYKEKRNPIKYLEEQVGELIKARLVKKIEKLDLKPANLAVELPPLGQETFAGIQSIIDENEITHVLTIHGMRTKSSGNFDEMTKGLVKVLRFNPQVSRESLHQVHLPDSKTVSGGSAIKIQEFANSKGKILRFYHLHWSPLTYAPKNWLDNLSKPRLLVDSISSQSIFSQNLKESIFIDGFSDVALGVRGLNDQVRQLIDTGFSLMFTENPFTEKGQKKGISNPDRNSAKNMVFVSGSLGSKLLYDHLVDALNEPRDSLPKYYSNATNAYKRLHTFFMLTNQLSLISLKDLPGTVKKEEFAQHVYGSWQGIPNNRLKNDPLRIIAFNDPNDLLSFPLPKVPDPLDPYLSVVNCPMNIAAGFSIHNYQLYDLFKDLEKKLLTPKERRQLRKNARTSRNDKISKLKHNHETQLPFIPDSLKGKLLLQLDQELNLLSASKRDDIRAYLNFALDIDKYLIPIIDPNQVSQDYVFRFDVAHEGVSRHPNIINMLSYGTNRIRRKREAEKINP